MASMRAKASEADAILFNHLLYHILFPDMSGRSSKCGERSGTAMRAPAVSDAIFGYLFFTPHYLRLPSNLAQLSYRRHNIMNAGCVRRMQPSGHLAAGGDKSADSCNGIYQDSGARGERPAGRPAHVGIVYTFHRIAAWEHVFTTQREYVLIVCVGTVILPIPAVLPKGTYIPQREILFHTQKQVQETISDVTGAHW
ncbi:hypothetical protein ACJJTC_010793 [Scirpophaga incertulas]